MIIFISAYPLFFKMLDLHLQTKKLWEICYLYLVDKWHNFCIKMYPLLTLFSFSYHFYITTNKLLDPNEIYISGAFLVYKGLLSWVWHLIVSDGDSLILKIWEMWRTPSMSLLPGLFRLGVVVPARVKFMVQLDLYQNYSYLIGPCANKKQLHINVNMN